MSEVDYEELLTIMEQADRACALHNTDLARQYIGTIKMLLYKLKEEDLKIVPVQEIAA